VWVTLWVTLCSAARPLPPPPPYTSATSGATYTLRLSPADASAAQAECNMAGGHLAAYASIEEQVGLMLMMLPCC
jgi:hypothetical protein